MSVVVLLQNRPMLIGDVSCFVTHPDGKTFFRVADHWFPADMCELVE